MLDAREDTMRRECHGWTEASATEGRELSASLSLVEKTTDEVEEAINFHWSPLLSWASRPCRHAYPYVKDRDEGVGY